MSPEAVGQLAHSLDRLIAALGDHVGGHELVRKCDPVFVAAEDDDRLGTQAPGGDHAAEADGAVADDGDALAEADDGGHRRVVAGTQHVREREQRRKQCLVSGSIQRIERPVSLRDAQCFGLGPADPAAVSEEPTMDARGLQAVVAEDAVAVRVRERHHDQIARLQHPDVRTDLLDDADCLVAHDPGTLTRVEARVGPQVAAADAGARDADNRVCRLDDLRVFHLFDADVAGAMHNSCLHHFLLSRVCGSPEKRPSSQTCSYSLLDFAC
jgi:hypothetical protein